MPATPLIFAGFREIGSRRWSPEFGAASHSAPIIRRPCRNVHTNPADANVEPFFDLKSRWMVPMTMGRSDSRTSPVDDRPPCKWGGAGKSKSVGAGRGIRGPVVVMEEGSDPNSSDRRFFGPPDSSDPAQSGVEGWKTLLVEFFLQTILQIVPAFLV